MIENSDLILQFAITDSAGAAINITTGMTDLEIAIFVKENIIIQKFVKSLSQITTVSAEGGTVKINVDRKNLNGYAGRKIYAEVKVIITNASFESSREWRKDIVEIGTLENSLI